MDNWRVRGTKIYFPGACEEYAIRIQPYQHADSIHDPSATGGERGGHVHIWLAVGCISIAVLTYIAFSLGIFPGARTLVFAIVLGFLLLPIVFLDPVHGLMAFAIIAPLSPDFNFANNVRAQDPLVAIIILGVLFRMARHSGPRVPMPLKNTLLLYLLWGLICTPVGFISGAFPNDYPNFFYLAKHAELIFLSFAVALSVHSNKQLWMIMSAMLVGLILQQFQFQFEFLDVPKDQRYQGGAIDEGANVLAMYF
ncbi:MAG: hypothetical protein L6Q71_09325, partial [Planctomycetes bacterium]|nr:hypothetical protein [Planctomycetota bacterium]